MHLERRAAFLQLICAGRPALPRENRALAVAAAKKDIGIDDKNAEAHAVLGFVKLYEWGWATRIATPGTAAARRQRSSTPRRRP
jgi:hypothetical protein